MVVTDQPFYAVNDVEFRDLLIYTHHPSPTLKIPFRNAMKERIMKLGDETIRATRQMFKVGTLVMQRSRSSTPTLTP
jgi:hypothetical protein